MSGRRKTLDHEGCEIVVHLGTQSQRMCIHGGREVADASSQT